MLLRCDDTEFDVRVDRESCRALGIRSIVAVPVRVGPKSIGLLEAFSGQPNSFSETDGGMLQRFADTVLAAVNRAARAENLSPLSAAPVAPQFAPTPGSVLFASAPEEENKTSVSQVRTSPGISLPRSHLILLICAAAVIALVLGYNLAPLLQGNLQERGQGQLQTVLASSQPPKSGNPSPSEPPAPSIETASFEQLLQMAEKGDPAAENAVGLRYFQGDDQNKIGQDEKQASRWFRRAAEHGNLSAQAKLGFLFWGGRGVSKDVNQAYFWTVLARARGNKENQDLAAVLASRLTRSQAAVIEQQADLWLQQHMANWKPSAGH
jgi:hypothetical protein